MYLKQGIIVFISIFFFITNHSSAQNNRKEKEKKDPYKSTTVWGEIPVNRQGFHAYVDKQLKKADYIDGFGDNAISIENKKQKSAMLTKAILVTPKRIQAIIENLPIEHWDKVRYLKYLEVNLSTFNSDFDGKAAKIDEHYYLQMMESFIDIMKLKIENGDIVNYIRNNFQPGLYGNLHMFQDNQDAKDALYQKMVEANPEKMLLKLREFANTTSADLLIANTAKKSPNLILTYAKSTSIERDIVNRSKDPLVQSIVGLANKTDNSLKALPFLNDIHNGKLSYDSVNKIIASPALYFKQLVSTRISKPEIGNDVVLRELKHEALETYVRTVNELHDSPAPIRFKGVENLTAAEMYYLMVLCSDEIYTSSFTGLFDRMLTKMKPQSGDVFLDSLNKDKFRTFIRMSAGYNKLDTFLRTMGENEKSNLMSSFVNNIDENIETDLEDAVDVADALGSLNDDKTLKYLQGELKNNYERTYNANNKRGLVIYFLLHTLSNAILNPNDSSDDLQKILKVPPITKVLYSDLCDDSGRVYQQHFFYGDEDGLSSFASFGANFPAAKWAKEDSKEWVKYSSKTGKPIIVYANKPLPEPEDEAAQQHLNEFLIEHNIHPSILVHRGHSYHLPGTLKYIGPDNAIVILGSCGGYHNLSSILDQSEDAHIVSSKQTGTMRVNDPLLAEVNNYLMEGKDVQWTPIWGSLDKKFKNTAVYDQFNDYVPPHKNMGALFLKAFKIQLADLE